MKRLLVAVAVVGVAMLVTISWAATNLNSSRSNIYREFPGTRLVTASTALSRANETQAVFITAATGDFVLTQFCSDAVTGGVVLSAVRLGSIAQTAGGNLCYTFQPGFIMPQGAAISCTLGQLAETGNHFCSIAGLVRE
jgi:hypothetical protein